MRKIPQLFRSCWTEIFHPTTLVIFSHRNRRTATLYWAFIRVLFRFNVRIGRSRLWELSFHFSFVFRLLSFEVWHKQQPERRLEKKSRIRSLTLFRYLSAEWTLTLCRCAWWVRFGIRIEIKVSRFLASTRKTDGWKVLSDTLLCRTELKIGFN